MTENKSPLLTDIEAAALFNVSRPTLWRWRKSIPNFPSPVRIGPRAVRYRRADIEAFIAAAAPALRHSSPPPRAPKTPHRKRNAKEWPGLDKPSGNRINDLAVS